MTSGRSRPGKWRRVGPETGRERQRDVEEDRQQERLPGHRDVGDAEQERHDRREGHNHDKVVHRDLDQRVGLVAPRQLRPDEDHGGAGRGAEQDQASDVLRPVIGRDQRREDVLEERHRQRRHSERLDQPVDGERDQQACGLPRDLAQRARVDADHHRVDHRPDQHRDDEVDVRDLGRGDGLDQRWRDGADDDAGDHRQRDPGGEVPLERAHARAVRSACGSSRVAPIQLRTTMTAAVPRQSGRPPSWKVRPERSVPINRPAAFAM